MTKKEITYADAGVNIELGDDVSKILYEAAKQTWDNRKGRIGELVVLIDDFSGFRGINVSGLKDTILNFGFDGIGTKVELAERLNNHTTMAYDLFAMVCDDAVVRGGEPVVVGSILDVNALSKGDSVYLEQVKQLAMGYVGAAKQANVAIINGEVAELNRRVGGHGEFNYNWGSGVIWFVEKDKIITGKKIQPGDAVVALKEEGLRSNGISLVRKLLTNQFGEDYHIHEEGRQWTQKALHPSRIYSATVVDMYGAHGEEAKVPIHGVAHITGGGVPGKLGRVLSPSGLGAILNDLYSPCDLMLKCQEWGNVSDEEAYKTWNMGQGMLIITPNPGEVIKIAQNQSVPAKFVGLVTKDPTIKIKSKGYHSPQEFIEYQ